MASLRTDVNDTRAKIDELRWELMDSTVGLATSIKEIEAIVRDIDAQATTAPQDVHGTGTPMPPTSPGVPLDPPLMIDNACTTRFRLPDGVVPTFRGAASFTPGNRSPHASGSQQVGGSSQDIRPTVATPP